MPQIEAYRKDTGEKVRIPEHWLDDPILGKPFRKTPTQRARENQGGPAADENVAVATDQKGK